jgi:hypothetical protein
VVKVCGSDRGGQFISKLGENDRPEDFRSCQQTGAGSGTFENVDLEMAEGVFLRAHFLTMVSGVPHRCSSRRTLPSPDHRSLVEFNDPKATPNIAYNRSDYSAL